MQKVYKYKLKKQISYLYNKLNINDCFKEYKISI